jgi:hypothetical protein
VAISTAAEKEGMGLRTIHSWVWMDLEKVANVATGYRVAAQDRQVAVP